MKIVIATPFYPPEQGVLGTYAAGLEAALRRVGHDVVIVSIGSLKNLPPGIRHIAFFFKVLTAARSSSVILALDTWSVGMPAFYAARLRGVRFLVRVGGDFLWESYVERTKEPVRLSEFYTQSRALTLKEKCIRAGTKSLVRHATLLFNSRFQRDIWKKSYGLPPERARIMENFFPERQMGESPQNRVFVSAGRPIALKKYDELERAFARVRERYPKAELDTRPLPHNEHLARVRGCYAIIIPSVSEASSNTAIDAVVAGKPFIMTDDTGTSERLGECGLFIDTRSEEQLVEAIEKLLNSETYEYLRSRIHAFSFTHTWDDMAREILDAV
jgi:glycosyltransferase involved in cell wall biosynthesis